MDLGVCSCNAGRDGSPCSHQAAIVKCYHIQSVNCVPVLSPETRQKLATIALGSSSVKAPQFYSSLHEKNLSALVESPPSGSFEGSAWDLVKGSVSPAEEESTNQKDTVDYDAMLSDIDDVVADIKVRIRDSSIVAEGTKVFLKRYKEMIKQGKFANAALGSALYKFGLGQCEVRKVGICAVVAESLSVLRQLVVDVVILQEEK